MKQVAFRGFLLLHLLLVAAAVPGSTAAAQEQHPEPLLSGRLEEGEGGLRILRLWGGPRERGFAHGWLMASEIVALVEREYAFRYAGPRRNVLRNLRRSVDRMVAFPPAMREEMEAVMEGIRARGADLELPGEEREVDLHDLLVVNALDVLGFMGCSGFTVWGERSEGGSVLTARNFDWPYSSRGFVEGSLLIVQHPEAGAAFASVAWPGYVGVVTGVSERGVAVFLHVGDGAFSPARPETLPSAAAAREILQRAGPATAAGVASEVLQGIHPPSSMIFRVVAAAAEEGAVPEMVFEVDSKGSTPRTAGDWSVTTNHFLAREGGGFSPADSPVRYRRLVRALEERCAKPGGVVGPEDAWRMLDSVAAAARGFGTLHSVLFSPDPLRLWVGIAHVREDRLVPPTRGEPVLLVGGDLFRRPDLQEPAQGGAPEGR